MHAVQRALVAYLCSPAGPPCNTCTEPELSFAGVSGGVWIALTLVLPSASSLLPESYKAPPRGLRGRDQTGQQLGGKHWVIQTNG